MTFTYNLEKIRDKIANIINDLTSQMKHSGSLLIAINEEPIYENYFGCADYLKKIPLTKDTQFLAGSVTKQFTAVALLKALLDNNITKYKDSELKNHIQLELNKKIEYFLPKNHEIWNASMPAWATTVTVHQLLVHSAGIINYTSLPDFDKQNFTKKSDLVSFFKKHDLEFSPGEKFSYSNSGYYLLGIIIEQITRQSFDKYLEEVFFSPLQMRSTYLPVRGTVDDLIRKDPRFAHLARGYQYEITKKDAGLTEVTHYESMENPGGAGSLISTAEDLLKWNNALYAEKIIPKCLLELFLNPYLVTERMEAYYGYGIEIMKSGMLGKYYSHRGGIPGFRSILTFIPSLKMSIVTMQNLAADPEKIIPEIENIKARLPQTLSQEESSLELSKIIEDRYPSIIENRKHYEFAPIYDNIIKTLEEVVILK